MYNGILRSLRYKSRWPLLRVPPSSLFQHERQKDIRHVPHGPNRNYSDPFVILSLDSVLDILDLLSIREVLLLSIASVVVSRSLQISDFWRRRVTKDMPWFWDLDYDDSDSNTDWRKVYFDLWRMCVYEYRDRELGLVNRKRIWNISLGLMETCACMDRTRQAVEKE